MSGMQDESLRAMEGQLAASQADSEAMQERITNSEAMVWSWSRVYSVVCSVVAGSDGHSVSCSMKTCALSW